METTANILKIGNSCGVIIPSQVMKSLSLSVKDSLKLSEVDGKIILEKFDGSVKCSPFDSLDIWCREKGYGEETVGEALDYISSIRQERNNKDIPQW
jgi:antitoxin component of MazEF toxin-antitoxin module